MVNVGVKFEVSSCNCFRDILGGVKFYNVSRDPDYALFMDNLTSTGLDLLSSNCVPNLKYLALVVLEIFKWVYNSKMGHVIQTTPFSGMLYHWPAGTYCGQPTHQISSL